MSISIENYWETIEQRLDQFPIGRKFTIERLLAQEWPDLGHSDRQELGKQFYSHVTERRLPEVYPLQYPHKPAQEYARVLPWSDKP